MNDNPCCACLTVKWTTEQVEGGGTRGWWECKSCGNKFIQAGMMKWKVSELEGQVAACAEVAWESVWASFKDLKDTTPRRRCTDCGAIFLSRQDAIQVNFHREGCSVAQAIADLDSPFVAAEAYKQRITEPLRARVEQLEAELRQFGNEDNWRETTLYGDEDNYDAYAWSPPAISEATEGREAEYHKHFHAPWKIAQEALATPPTDWLTAKLAAAKAEGAADHIDQLADKMERAHFSWDAFKVTWLRDEAKRIRAEAARKEQG